MREPFIIEVVVGFMLKVMKCGTNITKFQKEFAAIRHGNYDDFFDLVKGERPQMVVWHEGIISDQETVSQKTHCDFAGLLLVGPSLMKFFDECLDEYGKEYLQDNDEIGNVTYSRVVLFEVGLRMHANNEKLLNGQESLFNVINKLGAFKLLSQQSIEKLHKGRDFTNDIKHHLEPDYKRKFATWSDGIIAFDEAYKVVEENMFTIE